MRSAALGVTLVALAVLITTGIFVFASSRNSGGSAQLNSSLKDGSRKLQQLQDESNQARSTLSKTFDLLDKQLNLLGKSGGAGIPEAKVAWPQAPALMGQARDANARLPKVTLEIVQVAGKSRHEIRDIYQSMGRREQNYARALDEALESLTNTQVKYSEVDARLAQGFPDYDRLFSTIDRFYKELATNRFKTTAVASQAFSLATSPLVEPLAAFRNDLQRLESAAAESGQKTLDAFKKAAGFRQSA